MCISCSVTNQALLCIYSLSVGESLNCNFLRERSSYMKYLSTTIITAARLYDISLTTVVKCNSYCVNDANCLYMTVDKMASRCTFYSAGYTNFNVSQSQTFELMESTIQVFINAHCYKIH